MKTIKLIVSHKGRLEEKYGVDGLNKINAAIKSLIAKDKEREIVTHYIYLDDEEAAKRYGIKAISGKPSAMKCKRAIDTLFAALSPDYLVLLGSDDVIPHFSVSNPSFDPLRRDRDATVATDNPYACSRKFSEAKRESYLIPDRVVGRIPDLPGSNDPSWLLDYLEVAEAWSPGTVDDYTDDLFVCCDVWKNSGKECVKYLTREEKRLLLSPPTLDGSSTIRTRHKARFQMIKCHGNPLSGAYLGESAKPHDTPEVMLSTSLLNKTVEKTVVGAMCCYGAALFDPSDPASLTSGAPPIPSVYLKQGAYGFFGSTTVAWVGINKMLCADWIVTESLRAVMNGASLGRALLDAKQRLVARIKAEGRIPNKGEEKTLLQFHLLGDPAIHLVSSASSLSDLAAAGLEGATTTTAFTYSIGVADERRARRQFRYEIGEQLRRSLPERKDIEYSAADAGRVLEETMRALGEEAATALAGFELRAFSEPLVQEVTHPITQPELTTAGMMRVTAEGARASGRVAPQKTVEYYYMARRETERFIDARMIFVETDERGNVLRTQVLASA